VSSHVSGNAYTITASGAVDSDYTISYVGGKLTVTPVALTITADNKTMPYGGSLPALTASYAGFVNGDTPASLTTAPALNTTATSQSPVGTYAITASGAVDPDYGISYVPGVLTVSKATTSTVVSSSANPSAFLQSVTFSATVTTNAPGSGTPTGTVTFNDGKGFGSVTVAVNSSGVATFTTSKLTVGTHSITASYNGDTNFTSSASPVLTQMVNKKKALVVASGAASGVSDSARLTQTALAAIVTEAIVLWWEAGIDSQRLAAVSEVHVQISDLPGPDLGLASPGLIEIDSDAAGYGWYIDSAPNNASAFSPGVVNSGARDHVDLLSVVCHEMGHELGFEHDDGNDVMAESLAPGVRHVPISIRGASEALGLLFGVPTLVRSQSPVFLGPTTASGPLMALDTALADWTSSHHELAPQQVAAPMTASLVLAQDGTAGVVPHDQGRPRRLIIDVGSVDAVIESGSISSLLRADRIWRPTK
jgi:hypothetical protein